MLNVAVALVLAFVIICSTILSITFSQFCWPPVGGFIILVVGTYLYLKSSSARFYLRPNAPIHILFLCSYLLIGLASVIWQSTFERASEGLPAVMFLPILIFTMIVIIGSGVTALAMGIVLLFVQSKSIK